jgi:hypothetical protein
MKYATVDYPVLSWASARIEIPDDWDEDDVIDAIRNDEIDIIVDPAEVKDNMYLVLSIRDTLRTGSLGEVPEEIQVTIDD